MHLFLLPVALFEHWHFVGTKTLVMICREQVPSTIFPCVGAQVAVVLTGQWPYKSTIQCQQYEGPSHVHKPYILDLKFTNYYLRS